MATSLEMIVAYSAVGALSYMIESAIGNVFFVTVILFDVFAFLGFVYRYLWRHRLAATT